MRRRGFCKPFKTEVALTVIFDYIERGLGFDFLDRLFSLQLKSGDSRYIFHSQEYARWLNTNRNRSIDEDLIKFKHKIR